MLFGQFSLAGIKSIDNFYRM